MAPLGHLSPISANHDGTYTATLTASGFPATVTVGGTIAGSPMPGRPLKPMYVVYDNSGFAKRTIRVDRHNQTLLGPR